MRIRSGLSKKTWAMQAYIAGDNNLSDSGLEDIEEMCQVGASKDVHAAVEIDTYGEHTGSIRYEITEPDGSDGAFRTVIERLPERDTGSPTTLSDFLRWGMASYPADRRLAVIWNHGAGFRTARRDIAYDDFGTALDMPALGLALRAAGLGRGRKLSILGFDACLMNMLEVANHFVDFAEIVVGSQELEPGDGWPYDRVLAAMKGSPTPRALATQIVDLYIADYKSRREANVTQSAVDLVATETVAKSLGDLGRRIVTIGNAAAKQAMRKVRLDVQAFDVTNNDYNDYVDLRDAMALVKRHIGDAKAAAVDRAAHKSILHAGTYGAQVARATGLSFWFPIDRQTYAQFRTKYKALRAVTKYPGWLQFLDWYHAA